MVDVTDDFYTIRRRVNVYEDECDDEDVGKYVVEAAAQLSKKMGETVNETNCTEAQANAVRNWAAIYVFFHVNGGVTSLKIGELAEQYGSPNPLIEFLKAQIDDFVESYQEPAFVVGEAYY